MMANRDAPLFAICVSGVCVFGLGSMSMVVEARLVSAGSYSVKLRINQIAMAICGVTSQTGS